MGFGTLGVWVCARRSAPSVGLVEQAWKVGVLAAEELEHVWEERGL